MEENYKDDSKRTSESADSSNLPLLSDPAAYTEWDGDFKHRCRARNNLSLQQISLIIILSATLGSFLTVFALLIALPQLPLRFAPASCAPAPESSASTPFNNTVERLTCGSTIEEAQLNNCAFDQVTDAWLPLQCSRVGLDNFLESSGRGTPWEYYTDQNRTQRIHDLATNHGPYWTTEREHLSHCAYMLIRLADAWTNPGTRLDSKSGSFGHSKHCAELLLDRAMYSPTIDVMNSDGEIMVGEC